MYEVWRKGSLSLESANVTRGLLSGPVFREMPAGAAASGLRNAFGRVAVINLARRADRLARFFTRINGNWPFASPRRFEAIEGTSVPMPATWDKGVGAWGCLQSH